MAAEQQRNADDEFSQWVRDHGPAVRGYLLALVRRGDVADDLCQDVFRRAWQARDTYREAGKTRAYLLRIADRLVCDRARQSRRSIEQTLDDAGWQQIEPAADDDPSRLLSASESRRQLEQALARLTPVQQRVLLLRYYADLSFAEIAEVVGCPLNTALSHGRRGLLSLRKMLHEVRE